MQLRTTLSALAITAATLCYSTSGFALNLEDEPIQPIPQSVDVNPEKVALGEKLYNDTRLSGDGTVSCATCHALHKGGTDQLPVSKGIKDTLGPINAPTVFNAEHHIAQFWDGRAKDLQDQAAGPVENPKEMGEAWPNVVKKLKQDEAYVIAFQKLYDGELTKETVTDAIAEFERTLITPDSRFDQYLKGDESALTEQEKRGYTLFKDTGCTACHEGPYVGGTSYQALSEDYFKDRGREMTDADLGRYNVTKDEGDKHVFKVPTLRNIEVTAPYFHDGSVNTLEEAVTLMAKYQLGVEDMPTEDVDAIAAFLRSMTGKYKGTYVNQLKAAD